MKPLGEKQKDILQSLRSHGGYWYEGCGWLWDTVSGTKKVMESLTKRGLATKSVHQVAYGVRDRYDITEEGRKA